MDLVLLTETLVKKIVREPELVSVKEFGTDSEGYTLIQIMVSSNDMGNIIGSHGRIINAIRTIVQASSYVNKQNKVKINVDSF